MVSALDEAQSLPSSCYNIIYSISLDKKLVTPTLSLSTQVYIIVMVGERTGTSDHTAGGSLSTQGPVVQRVDNASHRINRYPADK